MRKLFCDHEELISELRSQRDNLKTENATLLKALLELKTVNSKPAPVPQIVSRLPGMPESLARVIDWERMGMQAPEVSGQRK